MTVTEILKELIALPDVEHGAGVTDADIAAAERALAVQMPATFKEYLRRVGWLTTGDYYYGLGEGVPPFADLVTATLSERTEAQPPIPPHLLPLLNDGGGNHFCLDLSRSSGDDAPVVFWDHADPRGAEQRPEDWAPSYTAWLARELETSRGG